MLEQNGKKYRCCRLSAENLDYMDSISNKRTYDEILSLLILFFKNNNDDSQNEGVEIFGKN